MDLKFLIGMKQTEWIKIPYLSPNWSENYENTNCQGFYLKLKWWIGRYFGIKFIYKHYGPKLKWKLFPEMGTTLKLFETNLFLVKIDSLYRVQKLLCFSNLKLNFLLCLNIVNWSSLWDAVIGYQTYFSVFSPNAGKYGPE